MYSQHKRKSLLATPDELEEKEPDYDIPTASHKHIKAFLVDLGIEITDDDLRRPNRSRIRQLFSLLIEHFLTWRAEKINKQKRDIVTTNNLSELDQDIAEVAIVFHEVKALLEELRCTDIGIVDFTDPSPERIQKLLTAIMNFGVFNKERAAPKSAPLAIKADQIGKEVIHLAKVEQELIEKIKETKKRKAIEQGECSKLQIENKALEQELINLRRECEIHIQELDNTKAERVAFKDKLQDLQMEVLQAIDVRKRLQEEEEWDIESMQDHIQKLEDTTSKLASEVKSDKEAYPKSEDQLTQLKVLDNLIARASQTLNRWSTRKNDLKRQKKTRDAVQKEIDAYASQDHGLVQELNASKRFAAAEELKIERLNEDQAKKRESMKLFWETRQKEDERLRQDEINAREHYLVHEKKRDELTQKISQTEFEEKSYEEKVTTYLRQIYYKAKEKSV
ncbi:Nuf2 family-domain-containing protein [Gilbertella persicaria]|uniref:Nuf2 family-domain-containing protein n=1 Tax=Gilbertella persicaria TaxID=101096 RepID=UPI00221E6855|nr:Nuf2 family-domain-containing protein [Gilbertella persicaria]KAI8083405.1 Nuf2 family-domain-containing protein [Gilbertella persicaria]